MSNPEELLHKALTTEEEFLDTEQGEEWLYEQMLADRD